MDKDDFAGLLAGVQQMKRHLRGHRVAGARVARIAPVDARKIRRVIGVPAIGGTAPRGDQAAIPQFAQVVRDQILRLADQAGQLVHHPVAPGQLAQKAPTQGMPGQLQEFQRRNVGMAVLRAHIGGIHQL